MQFYAVNTWFFHDNTLASDLGFLIMTPSCIQVVYITFIVLYMYVLDRRFYTIKFMNNYTKLTRQSSNQM